MHEKKIKLQKTPFRSSQQLNLVTVPETDTKMNKKGNVVTDEKKFHPHRLIPVCRPQSFSS